MRNNLSPELIPPFERVKRSAGARESRTEAFLRYGEAHPREYLEVMEERTDDLIRDLERQEEEALRGRHARNPAAPVEKLRAADPRRPSIALGELVAVVDRTPAGEVRHEFRSGARPRLAYNAGGLLIAGGEYRVSDFFEAR